MSVLLCARAGHADPPLSPVEVFVAAPLDTATRLEGAVGTAERPIHWVLTPQIEVSDVLQRPTGGRPESAARVWIDCSRADSVRLYFVNWNTERFLVRQVPLREGLNELALETVAQVIESSLSALMTDDRAGMSRAEMTSVLQPAIEAHPVDRHAPLEASIGAFYALQGFASQPPVEHGPGVLGTLDRGQGRWRPGGWLSAQYQLPEILESTVVDARLDTIALRAGAEIVRVLSTRSALVGRLGAGGNVVHIAPRQASARATLTPDRFAWEYAVKVEVGATTRVAADVALWAGLLADFVIDSRRYEVAVDGTVVQVATPWPVRPGLAVGVSFR